MIEISQIRVPCGADPDTVLDSRIRKILRLRGNVRFTRQIIRHSVDARRKPVLYDIYSVRVRFPERSKRPEGDHRPESGADQTGRDAPEEEAFEKQLVRRIDDRNVKYCEEVCYRFPSPVYGASELLHRPVIIGFGPAGIFCALMLARAGYRPIVLERGQRMEDRIETVSRFWDGGGLNPESNIQFGEGGAGTFSDGKLTSNVKDSSGRIPEILRILVMAGAPEDIRYEQLPHIGTDRLRGVIRNLREEILSLGGEIRFDTRATGLILQNRRVTGVRYRTARRQSGRMPEPPGEIGSAALPAGRDAAAEEGSARESEEMLPCEVVILAPGHSSRDTVRLLLSEGVPMSPKDFAVGVRVSHPQSMINQTQYGISDPEELHRLHLAPASYRLTAGGREGRGVYSFCMCPGGWVVNASSEEGRLVVNGMSDYARDADRANSAIVMTVSQRDWSAGFGESVPGGERDILAGMRFQEELEERAYHLAGGRIPVQRLSSFEEGRTDTQIPSSGQLGIRGQSAPGALHTLLPDALTEDFLSAMHEFGRKIDGFDGPQAWVIGLESRTSSPVRILRDERGESAVRGLYPCGEGAGYAGGIMSAAVDGIRIAEQIGQRYRPFGR